MYTGLLGWAWVSPTPAWLHCVYACLLVCLAWPLMVNFKRVHSHLSWCWNVQCIHTSAQTHENKDVRPLPDCTVGVKESKSKNDLQFECIASTRQLCDKSMLWVRRSCVTRQVVSDRMYGGEGCFKYWHDCSYTVFVYMQFPCMTRKRNNAYLLCSTHRLNKLWNWSNHILTWVYVVISAVYAWLLMNIWTAHGYLNSSWLWTPVTL